MAAVKPLSAVNASLVRTRNVTIGIGVAALIFITLLLLGSIHVLTRPLAALPGIWGTLAVGLTELFSLTPRLTADATGFILAAGCSGWGGLSVLCQTAAMLEGTGLPLAPCLRGKAVQGLISVLLAAGLVLTGWV